MTESDKPKPKNFKLLAFEQFEKQGEDAVRLWLQTSQDATALEIKQRRSWAAEWLAKFDQEARLRNEASQAESLAVATSAKDAAWAAAEAARAAAREASKANTIATLALVAAVIAIAVSIVSAFLR